MLISDVLHSSKTKNILPLIVAPFAVVLLMSAVFAVYHLYPFGQNTLSWCDMTQQVIPILLQFKDILAGKQNLFLNTSTAGGMNFWGVFLFFISSPFSFLTALVSKSDMILFVNIMVVLKMMVCALTAAAFFRRKFKNLATGAVVCLSVIYALCGYTMLFYQNIVWLDMMYLFPLLLLALDQLLHEHKIIAYVAVLSAMLAVNFYLSYMIVIFIVISIGLFVFLCLEKEQRQQSTALLGVGSVISAFITAAVWLPALKQYLVSGRTAGLLSNLSDGKFTADLFTTLPLLLCSALLFAVLPFFMAGNPPQDNQDNKKTVWCVLLLFLLMIIPVFIEPINKMWHTGNYQAFPVRYGYITVFLGLILTAVILQREYKKPDVVSSKTALFPALASVTAVYCVSFYLLTQHKNEINSYTTTLWGSKTSFTYLFMFFVVAILCYSCTLFLFHFGYLSKRVFTVLLCLLVAGECVFNSGVYIGSVSHGVQGYRQVLDLENKIQDEDFYRVKTKAKYFDVNLMGGLGYPTLGHYTSLNSQDYMFALKKLGYSSYWMEVNSNGGTLLTDALFSNRYTIIRADNFIDADKVVYQNNGYAISKNELCLPLGIKTANTLSETLPDTTRIDVQESLYSGLLDGKGKLFTEYAFAGSENIRYSKSDYFNLKKQDDAKNAAFTYQITVTDRQVLYFDCFMYLSNRLKELINDSFQISVDGIVVERSYPNQQTNGLYELGTFENQTVTVEVKLLKNITAKSFGVYGLDVGKLEDAISKVQGVPMKVSGNQIKAVCDATQGEVLHIALPYDNGYRATVNGKAVEINKVNDDFMAIPLREGENQIVLTFLPDGFPAGILLSAMGIILLLLSLWWLHRRQYRLPHFVQSICSAAFGALALGTFLVIYVFPVAVYFIL